MQYACVTVSFHSSILFITFMLNLSKEISKNLNPIYLNIDRLMDEVSTT